MKLFVDPGELRTELVLERCETAQDSSGGLTETWVEETAVMARLEPVVATSIFGADQTLESVTHRVTVRQRENIASGMRFTKGQRTFTIVTVHDPDERGRYLVCRVRELGL
jgi:SPP1 family predicted phage head-tail adaptor